ncbi:MAG: hypothetical protein PHW82_10635 [Bacteroidales bacterium]|nr:hypothetical protein [Bacteroidales bacterium]
MKVTLSNDNLSFCEVINQIENTNYNEGQGKLIALHRIRENSDYFLGYMNTTKQKGIPPKHNPRENTFEQLPINEGDGEGLGFSNVFIFDKTHQVIMYEFNKNGCYLASFRNYIRHLYNNDAEERLNLSFSPLLRLEAYQRMLQVDIYKTLEVKIATPIRPIQDFLDENDALSSAISTSQLLQSDTVNLKFDIKGRPLNGMPTQAISNLIRRIERLATGYDESIVEKFVICGYYNDIENDTLRKDEIDFLLDRYQKTFNVDEPNVLSNTQTHEKSTALFNVYWDCKGDFEILAPIV